VGTWPGEKPANREVADLRKRGIPAAVTYDRIADMDFGYSGGDVFTVHTGSFRSKKSSDLETARLRRKGHTAFSAAYDIPGKGTWRRVFAGIYRTRGEAVKAARQFPDARPFLLEGEFHEICVRFPATKEEAVYEAHELKKNGFTFAEIEKKPYAIRIGASDSETELAQIEYDAEQEGFLPYRVPDRENRYVARILIGAFEAEKEASAMKNRLEKLGFKPVVVLR